MGFKEIKLEEALRVYGEISQSKKNTEKYFTGFDLFYHNLYAQKFLVIKNNFKLRYFTFFENEMPQLFVCLFVKNKIAENEKKSKVSLQDLNFSCRLGYVHKATSCSESAEIEFVKNISEILSTLNMKVMGPMNGHINLGFSIFNDLINTKKNEPTFLTSGVPFAQHNIFSAVGFDKIRTYDAYRVKTNKINLSSPNCPEGISVRSLSLINFKNDIRIYNKLVNLCLQQHPFFEPLAFSEEWDLMRTMFLFINPKYFQFLLFNNKEIGFCFGISDYNQILDPKKNDWQNTVAVILEKLKPQRFSKITRGRIIYSGLMPEFRGRGLFKIVRQKVIQNMIDDGFTEIESSYIDESNEVSRNNVISTGAELSHQFLLYGYTK